LDSQLPGSRAEAGGFDPQDMVDRMKVSCARPS
jgi:hypothetical protein